MTVETERLDEHFADALVPLVEHSDVGVLARRDGIAVTAVGRAGPVINTATVLSAPRDPAAAVAWAVGLLSSTGARYAVQVPTGLRASVADELAHHGLVLEGTSPAMALDRVGATPPAPRGLRITAVTDAAMLADHVLAITRGFGGSDPTGLASALPVTLLAEPRVAFLSGYVDGPNEPVATAVSVVTHGIAGIFGVTVAEAARRRGYGAAITWAAVEAGARAGADAAALQAPPLGAPVYAAMGFREVRTFERYAPG